MKHWLALAALLLTACGGANAPDNQPGGFVSQLVKFDGEDLVGGVELIDATEYWTHSEARNGNAFPIKAASGAADTLVVRAMPGGEFQAREGDKFVATDLPGLRKRLEPLVKATIADGESAASCVMLLAAHVDAPTESLAQLCFTCVQMKVGNLWLATRDKRDGACRLLNLKLNPQRQGEPWYGYAPDMPQDGSCARLEWRQGLPSMIMAKGRRLDVREAVNWGKALSQSLASQNPRPRQLQLPLARGTTLREVQTTLHELAGAAIAEIEPLWPLAESSPLVDANIFWRATQLPRTEIEGPDDGRTLFARIQPGGKIATRVGAAWDESGLSGLKARLKTMADATRAGADAGCTLNVLADPGAQWRSLLEICALCVECRVPGLRLCTRERGIFARLLPLKVDTTQAGAKAYRVADDQQSNIVLMQWTDKTPAFRFGDGKGYGVDEVKDWGKALRKLVDARDPKPQRLLLEFPLDEDLARLSAVLADPVSGRFTEIEPLWPALLTKPQAPRVSVPFEDRIGLAKRIEPPELATYWKAAAGSQRMSLPAVVDAKRPVLYLCAGADNRWSSRSAESDWKTHADDQELHKVLEASAKLEAGQAVSALQVVLGMDRSAHWKCALGLAEMMVSARAATLYVLTFDGTGLYLLDLSLPVDNGSGIGSTAAVSIRREGAAAEAKYTADLRLGDQATKTFAGETWLEDLRKGAEQAKMKAEMFGVAIPADEAAQLFFRVIEATASLEPAFFHLQKPAGVLPLPPKPEMPPGDD